MSTPTSELVVRKTLTVHATPEHAFAVFTGRMTEWWPLLTHSVHGARARTVTLEPGTGGRLYESAEGGEQSDWGRVLAWEPPARVVLSWHPGQPPEESTEIEVTFAADGEGTRVELEHRGWEARGAEGATARASYDEGWNPVLASYAEVAER